MLSSFIPRFIHSSIGHLFNRNKFTSALMDSKMASNVDGDKIDATQVLVNHFMLIKHLLFLQMPMS